MNSINISGRLTKDPECREFEDGKVVCDFTVAVNGYKKDDTVFVKVKAWGNRAKSCSKFCKKGSLVNVTGSLRPNSWKAKDGSMRREMFVLASDVEFVNTKPEEESAKKEKVNGNPAPSIEYSEEEKVELEDQLETVPF